MKVTLTSDSCRDDSFREPACTEAAPQPLTARRGMHPTPAFSAVLSMSVPSLQQIPIRCFSTSAQGLRRSYSTFCGHIRARLRCTSPPAAPPHARPHTAQPRRALHASSMSRLLNPIGAVSAAMRTPARRRVVSVFRISMFGVYLISSRSVRHVRLALLCCRWCF